MDRLQTMRVFQAVADEAGFSAAARRLDMSVPTVTRLVADLEQHLARGCCSAPRAACR
jgi:DNA-binding transcriptional LysR family regulator